MSDRKPGLHSGPEENRTAFVPFEGGGTETPLAAKITGAPSRIVGGKRGRPAKELKQLPVSNATASQHGLHSPYPDGDKPEGSEIDLPPPT